MNKRLIILILLLSNIVFAETKQELVVIPKFTHPFFERIHYGCQKSASELNNVNCRYEAPRTMDVTEQVKILEDILNQDIAGIAIAPVSSAAIARVLKNSNKKNIPVITFDSDLRANDKALRKTYIGSNNENIGIELAKLLMKIRPQGGTYMIQAGEPPAENLKERLNGFLKTIDNSIWKEVAGSPTYCNASSQLAVQQLEDTLIANPNLNAYVALGAWPQVAKQGYMQVVDNHINRVKNNELVLLVADTLDMQIQLVKEGYGQGLVGQRPFEMGYQAIKILNQLVTDPNATLSDPIYTGLDICEKKNIDSCTISNNR
jgi:ribose transport system substrate-binding protein